MLLLASTPFLPASRGIEARTLPLAVGDVVDVVTLAPQDAEGRRWAGDLAGREGSVRLVWRDGFALGVLALPGTARWITVEDGRLVEDGSGGRGNAALGDDQVFAPASPASEGSEPSPAPAVDGILQVRIVADFAALSKFGNAWYPHAQDMVYLAEWLYYAQFRVTWDAVAYLQWNGPDPYRTATLMCGGAGTQIRLFRDNEEVAVPVLTNPHEINVLLTGTAFPDAIGCAYVAQIETPWAYAVVGLEQADLEDLKRDTSVLMHEIGHNFGGLHDRAFPREDGPLDIPCWTPNTVQYRYVCVASGIPQFSDGRGVATSQLHSANLLKDGGNAAWMRAYFTPRV